MTALTRAGRFSSLSDDAPCERPECGRRLDEHSYGSYGKGAGRVDVPLVCPHTAEPVGIPSLCAVCGKPTRQWPDGRFPIHAST